jgi:hypothetical protein
MEYQLILDIFGLIILSATFALCLRSFRREDHEHAQALPDAIAEQQSLAELLKLMDESAGRTVRIAPPRDEVDGIEVTVRVNKKRGFAAAAPVGSTEIVNAVWEPLTPEARHAGRLEGSEVTYCSTRESKPSAFLIPS